ncbi:signal peptidase I [Cytobacillus suaedae]|nr:signal peptidase I [Cytobacillus suaedae]
MQANFYPLKQFIEKNGFIELPAEGKSMYPFIKTGAICRFVLCESSSIKKGDIILFQTTNGKLVAHRFLKDEQINGRQMYVFKGDTNIRIDDPVSEQQIIGKLVIVSNKRLKIKVNNPISILWSMIIINFPSVSVLLRHYLYRNESMHY